MFRVPTFEEIRSTILNDITAQNKNADISVDSDNYIRASSLAALAEGLYAHQSWIVRQIFPDTSDREFLEQHAAIRDMFRKGATYSEGEAEIFGEKGRIIPKDTEIKVQDRYFTTLEATTLKNEKAEVRIKAKEKGASSNFHISQGGMLIAAPAGIRSECIVTTRGGTDVETDAELLARYLELVRRPPAGGNKYDYRKWALEVPGITNAYVYPLRRGLGTVDIAVTSGDDLPTQSVIEACQKHIDDVRSVTAKHSYVVAPKVLRVDLDITVKLQGITLDDARVSIKIALDDHFARVAPGETLVISQIEALISDQVGIVDRKLVKPNKNIVPDPVLIEWFRLGNLKIEEMKS